MAWAGGDVRSSCGDFRLDEHGVFDPGGLAAHGDGFRLIQAQRSGHGGPPPRHPLAGLFWRGVWRARIGGFAPVGLVAQGDGFWPSCRAGMGKDRSNGQRRNTDWPGPRCGGANPRGAWGTGSVGQWTGMLGGEEPRGGRSQRCIAGGGGLRFRQRRRGLSRVFPREPLAVPWAIANGDVEQGWAGEGVAS